MRHDTFCRLLHLTWNGIGLIINFRWQPFCVVFIGPIVIVQMHTYTNTYTYACMHILLYIHTNVCIQTYMDAYIIYMHTYIYSSHAHTLYTYIYMQKSCMHLMHTNVCNTCFDYIKTCIVWIEPNPCVESHTTEKSQTECNDMHLQRSLSLGSKGQP